MDDYLSKPLDAQTMLAMVSAWLERSRLTEEWSNRAG
jgi:DNA-binding response OmpR family regulator